MNLEQFAKLPATLNALAGDLVTLPDFADLPPLHAVALEWDRTAATFKLLAQLSAVGDDFAQIAAVNAWAVALGGHTLLGDEARSSLGYLWRSLSAVAPLPGGFLFEVWTHLTYPIPAADLAAA